jgi:hypothetical protein
VALELEGISIVLVVDTAFDVDPRFEVGFLLVMVTEGTLCGVAVDVEDVYIIVVVENALLAVSSDGDGNCVFVQPYVLPPKLLSEEQMSGVDCPVSLFCNIGRGERSDTIIFI